MRAKCSLRVLVLFSSLVVFIGGCVAAPESATEFCLSGSYDLGVRHQGLRPTQSETAPASWCVVTEPDSERVFFRWQGKSNPDMDGAYAMAFLPPDLVRIVNRESPPDVEFQGASSTDDAERHRRIDPRRLADEVRTSGAPEGVSVELASGGWASGDRASGELVQTVVASADVPLRGRVPVVWSWSWEDHDSPSVELTVAGELLFRGTGSWRDLSAQEADVFFQVTPGEEPIQAPGEQWPARVAMRRVDVAPGVFLVRGVRTGFQHLVVQTEAGLVVADAPAGWVELHQLPPTDLVPGLGLSGLSEALVDFLAEELADQPVRAVALTHAHDDHAGGARAFAAAGAEVYAPQLVAGFLDQALNAEAMPTDRLSRAGQRVTVLPVEETTILDDPERPVHLKSLGEHPHSDAALGVLLPQQNVFFVSDVHVPRDESDAPREGRALTECWFARWATEHLPSHTVVYNTHSPVTTPVARLAVYIESPACREQAP